MRWGERALIQGCHGSFLKSGVHPEAPSVEDVQLAQQPFIKMYFVIRILRNPV
jgi:hypothetical protein